MAEEHSKKTPRDLLRVAFRRRWLCFLGASLFAICVLIGSCYMLPLKYTGTSKFTRRIDAAALQTKGANFETGKATLEHDLAGEGAIEKAANDLGLPARHNIPRNADGTLSDKGKAQMLDLVRAIRKNVVIAWEVRSDQVDLLAVSFTDSDPNLAIEMANQIAKNYIEWLSTQLVSQLEGSKKFLSDQVERCHQQYETAVAERIAFESNCAGFIPATPGALDEMVRRMESDRDVLRRQNTLATKKLARWYSLEKELTAATQPASRPATHPASQPGSEPSSQPDGPSGELAEEVWGPNPKREKAEEELRQARDVMDEMVNVRLMTASHPAVQAQQRRIEQLEQRLAETPERIKTGTVYQTNPGGGGVAPRGVDLSVQISAAESEIEMTKNELERLDARLKEYQDLVLKYTPVRKEYEQLLRKCTERQGELKQWEVRFMDVKMSLEAEASKRRTHLESVQAARKENRPSSPKLLTILAVAIVGGLGFGGGLVFLINLMDRSIMTVEDAAKSFDVPVFGVIGEIVSPHQRVMRKLRKWLVAPVVSAAVLLTLGICALNVVLLLEFPEKHEDWRRNQVGFVKGSVQSVVTNILR